MLLDWAIAGGSKGFYSLARPNESESARHFDFAFVADADAVHETFKERAYFALFHPRAKMLPGVFHGERGQLVGQAHALDLLGGLDGASFDEQRRSVGDFAGDGGESVEEIFAEDGRLADHAVGGLRPLRKFEADAASESALAQNF